VVVEGGGGNVVVGAEVDVVGVLRRDPALEWRDRHLGLVPVVEDPRAVAASLTRLAGAVERGVDLDTVESLARRAPPLDPPPPAAATRTGRARVAVVSGPAFSFSYPDNLERLEESGAELVPVDPLRDPALPDGTQGLYACGGFPEVFAEELAANEPLLADVRDRVAGGLPTWAECGGLLWLVSSLDGHRLCGAIEAAGSMGSRVTVGYRTATALVDSPVAPQGAVLRGHEHHYSSVDPAGAALELTGRAGTRREGWAAPHLLATYLHLHLGADPGPAERFVATASRVSGPPSS